MEKELETKSSTSSTINKIKDAFEERYFGYDNKFNQDALRDDIHIIMFNTKDIYDAIYNNRRPSYIAPFLSLIRLAEDITDIKGLTNAQVKSALNYLGLDFKEILKPSVEDVEEARAERKAEELEESCAKETEKEQDKEDNKSGRKLLNETSSGWTDVTEDDIQVFVNTWSNYNNNGSDTSEIDAGWMSLDEAEKYLKEHPDEEVFISDIECDAENLSILREFTDDTPVDYIIECLRDFINCNDQEILDAIYASQNMDFEDCLDIYERGNYIYYPNVSDNSELAEAVINEQGGLSALSPDEIEYHFLEDDFRADNESDIMYTIAEENGYDSIDDVTQDEIDERLDEMIDEYMSDPIALMGEAEVERYFDYDDYGSDLAMDYTFTPYGAILLIG